MKWIIWKNQIIIWYSVIIDQIILVKLLTKASDNSELVGIILVDNKSHHEKTWTLF